MIDKARALNDRTLGDFWYGEDSGFDRALLDYLGRTPDDFAALVAGASSDEDVVAALDLKSESDREAFGHDLTCLAPDSDAGVDRMRRLVEALDPSRSDITTSAALTQLDDAVTWSRRKAGI